MNADESITDWIGQLKIGSDQAAEQLWQRYFERLVAASRRVLQRTSRAASDEEDVALSAFNSFCRCLAEDRFPKLDDRDDLWKILLTIAIRKALRVVRRGKAAGGDAIRVFAGPNRRWRALARIYCHSQRRISFPFSRIGEGEFAANRVI